MSIYCCRVLKHATRVLDHVIRVLEHVLGVLEHVPRALQHLTRVLEHGRVTGSCVSHRGAICVFLSKEHRQTRLNRNTRYLLILDTTVVGTLTEVAQEKLRTVTGVITYRSRSNYVQEQE